MKVPTSVNLAVFSQPFVGQFTINRVDISRRSISLEFPLERNGITWQSRRKVFYNDYHENLTIERSTFLSLTDFPYYTIIPLSPNFQKQDGIFLFLCELFLA